MVTLPALIHNHIASHGEKTYPEECCGILLGRMDHHQASIIDALEIPSTQITNRERRFLITPDQYREAERIAAERKLDLLGFYHSHPDHPAVPSEFDREHALPWFVYLIISVRIEKHGELRAWRLDDDRSKFLELEIIEGIGKGGYNGGKSYDSNAAASVHRPI